MVHKHLHELLKEDQEPFHLKTFIADRRSHLKPTTAGAGNKSLNTRKRKPFIQSTSSSTNAKNFCNNHVCLFSFQDSPDFKKSPFLDFPARELKSPCNKAGVFLHIPAVVLDAAARVQKPRPEPRPIGFGLLGSFLRRLKDRSSKAKNREIGPLNGAVTSCLTPERRSQRKNGNDGSEVGSVGGGVWSEKSPEMETSCSSRLVNSFDEIECLCSNPGSPFRFSIQRSRSPSPTGRRPDSSLSVGSPGGRFIQDEKSYQVDCLQEIDKEKEQSSPVSVFDTLFDDGDEEEERDDGAKEEDYNIECSYASVQRAKHELLQKLQRFERLAGLDPIKLENHMLQQCYNEDEDVLVNGEEMMDETLFREIVNHLGGGKIPWYMKKLIFDLIEEENKNEEHHVIVQRVSKRLHSWKVVELHTIDMMVETDFKHEGWKKRDEETIRDIGMDIEVAIFGLLMEELTQELVNYSSDGILKT